MDNLSTTTTTVKKYSRKITPTFCVDIFDMKGCGVLLTNNNRDDGEKQCKNCYNFHYREFIKLEREETKNAIKQLEEIENLLA